MCNEQRAGGTRIASISLFAVLVFTVELPSTEMRVLVIDDYPGAAQASCMLLATMGHETQIATTGVEAITLASSFEPEVIILDLGLPDVSGYEVARQIRTQSARRPFIVALTGWGATHDRVRSLAAGIDEHVVKPANADKLTAILEAAQRRLSEITGRDRG